MTQEHQQQQQHEGDKGLLERIVAAVKAVFDGPTPAPAADPLTPEGDTGLRFYKDADTGALRWFAWVSNNYRDRDGEIITDAAHREYVAYVDRTKAYPELQTWHTPGTRYGVADWVDYTDGFLVMAGTVDTTPEAQRVTTALQGKDLGVSHGFLQAYQDKEQGLIGWYRTFEVSSLPRSAAANVWTGIGLLEKEADMGFRSDKRAHLVEVWGEERVAALEKDTDSMRKAAAGAGVDFKDIWEADPPNPKPDPEPKPDPAPPPAPSTKEIAAETASMILASPAFKAIGDGVEAVKAQLEQQDQRLKVLEQDDDAKVAAMFVAKTASVNARSGGYRASQAGDTALGTDTQDAALKEATPIVDAGFMKSLRGV